MQIILELIAKKKATVTTDQLNRLFFASNFFLIQRQLMNSAIQLLKMVNIIFFFKWPQQIYVNGYNKGDTCVTHTRLH